MRLVIDTETDRLVNPTQIWVVACKDIDTGHYHIFRKVTEDAAEKQRLIALINSATLLVGHNSLEFDLPVISKLLGFEFTCERLDTLILSRLLNYSRESGHSIESYGEEFGLEKIDFKDWSKWSKELEDYCIRDVDICHKIFLKYRKQIEDEAWQPSIKLEHDFQSLVNDLHNNGFYFNKTKAEKLLEKVTYDLSVLDKDILDAFPPKEVLIREFIPKTTKFGTVSKTSVPRSLWDKIHEYEIGKTYRHTKLEPFNPSSHKQLIEVLSEAGWRPVNKTKTHLDTERELGRLKRQRGVDNSLDIKKLSDKLLGLSKTGWKIDEDNLDTLPPSAPAPTRLLAKRILLESRRRTLTEWLSLVSEDNRIRGKFQGIGAWTHRMAHQHPNTANIPSPTNIDGSTKLLGKEMRSLWCAPKNRLLVGVDAEGIQLRIFAHYINDPEFTEALVKGKKHDKSDPHSLNQRVIGGVCKSRAAAKRFIYALLLGAGLWKLSQILECSEVECKEALDRLLRRYTGWAYLKEEIIPKDAARGYFIGLDGRKVVIPGSTASERRHLCMSGYLQNGEAVVMKKAALHWNQLVRAEQWFEKAKALFVNMVHDEWQTEVPNNMEIALKVAKIQAESLRLVGEELELKCPLAGSYFNDDINDYTIGTNWYQTH